MSRPLSILATILLLIVPSLMTDRCTGGGPPVNPCPATLHARTALPDEAVDPESPSSRKSPRRPVWTGPMKWVFVAQNVAISIVHRVVLDRVEHGG